MTERTTRGMVQHSRYGSTRRRMRRNDPEGAAGYNRLHRTWYWIRDCCAVCSYGNTMHRVLVKWWSELEIVLSCQFRSTEW